MKTNGILITLLLYIVLISMFAGLAYLVTMFQFQPVQAAGYTTMSINCTESQYLVSSYGIWTTVTHEDTALSMAAQLGFEYSVGSGVNTYRVKHSILKFNMTSAPDISLINAMRIKMYCIQKSVYNAPTFQAPYFSIYDTTARLNGVISTDDNDNFNDLQVRNRLTNYYYWDDLTLNNWITFTVNPTDWATILSPSSSNNTFIDLVTEQHALDNIPAGTWSAGGGYQAYFYSTATQICSIDIDYALAAEVPNFDYHENAPVDNVTMGDEVADNITLSTLSCMYANENLEYDIEGDSGAPIVLRLVNSSGSTIVSLTDSIRTNGHYYWQIDSLPETYAGFVQAKENTYGLTSPWVSVQPQVDASQENLNIYSVTTEYPQYTKPFDTYVVGRGGLMYVHWKTNIDGDSDNLTDISLDIYNNGDNVRKSVV